MAIDVWMQHPTLQFQQHEMFDSLRRWTGKPTPTEELPIRATLASMDAGEGSERADQHDADLDRERFRAPQRLVEQPAFDRIERTRRQQWTPSP